MAAEEQTWSALAYATAWIFISEWFWLMMGAFVGAAGVLAPSFAGVALRISYRIFGKSSDHVWPYTTRDAPRLLLVAVPAGAFISGGLNLYLITLGYSWLGRVFCNLSCSALVFVSATGSTVWRFQASRGTPSVRSLHSLDVDGRNLELRVFVPEDACEIKRPAVVMVCGLLWLGEGLLGAIGRAFNDQFGYCFASCGVPCVQIATPNRHIAHTRFPEILAAVLWPLTLVPGLRFMLLTADALIFAITPADAIAGLLVAWSLPGLLGGPGTMLALHIAMRVLQFFLGRLPWPAHRSVLSEVAAAVTWAENHQEILRSDGRLVLCGYSSGAHCAALYGLSEGAPDFSNVVLVSGVYNLRTEAWSGSQRALTPLWHLVLKDALGVVSATERHMLAPTSPTQKQLKGEWYVLSARSELMGLHPFEDMLFDAGPLCDILETQGATVKRVVCGLNHWLLLFSIEDFIRPFCKALIG